MKKQRGGGLVRFLLVLTVLALIALRWEDVQGLVSRAIVGTLRIAGDRQEIAVDTEKTGDRTQSTEPVQPEETGEEEWYYYRKLHADDQELYRDILDGVQECRTTIPVEESDTEVIGRVYRYLLCDHPELFWCTGEMTITSYPLCAELEPVYLWTGEKLEKRKKRVEKAAAACLSGVDVDATDYQRVRHVFRYLVNHVDYNQNEKTNQSLYSALVRGESVCAGYSKAAQYLLQQLGIRCIYVTGTAGGEDHAWNIVRCDGMYYQMDVTFGDPTYSGEGNVSNNINYSYLCCTDEELYQDHTPSDLVKLPACRSERLNYYKIHDRYYTSYDADVLLREMRRSTADGEASFFCKFPEEVYKQVCGDVTNNLLPEAARTLAQQYGLSSGRYTYVTDDLFHTITVYWDYNE